jgi:predicted membrane protein
MVLLLSYFVLIEAAGSDARGFNSQLLRNRRANLVFFIKNSVLSIFGFEPLAELNASERQALPVLRRPLPPETYV